MYMYMRKREKCIELLLTFLKMGAFTFGGGYAMLPMIKRDMVEHKKWISEEEMIDMVAISEATPGPIVVNLATFVGSRIAGVWGAASATIGVIIPSFIIIILVSILFNVVKDMEIIQYAFTGIRVGVLVLVAKAVKMVFHNCDKKVFEYILMGVSFVLTAFAGANIIAVIIGAALLGILQNRIFSKGVK